MEKVRLLATYRMDKLTLNVIQCTVDPVPLLCLQHFVSYYILIIINVFIEQLSILGVLFGYIAVLGISKSITVKLLFYFSFIEIAIYPLQIN